MQPPCQAVRILPLQVRDLASGPTACASLTRHSGAARRLLLVFLAIQTRSNTMRLSRLTVAFLGILSLGLVARADDDDDDDRYRYRGGPPPWARRGRGDDDRL